MIDGGWRMEDGERFGGCLLYLAVGGLRWRCVDVVVVKEVLDI